MPTDSFDLAHERKMALLRLDHDDGYHAEEPCPGCPLCEEEGKC